MFLRCINTVLITQVPTATFPDRNNTIFLDFLSKYEIASTWETITDTAKVIIPKNVPTSNATGNMTATLIDSEGNSTIITMQGQDINIGGKTSPLFLRGDQISITAGYIYLDTNYSEQIYQKLLFQGYLTKVFSDLAITLECEDNGYLLKQIPVKNQSWAGYSMQDMLVKSISGTAAAAAGITVNTQSSSKFSFNVGTFTTSNETVAQVLARLRRDIGMVSYMKGTELRIWYPVYYDADIQNPLSPYTFVFQKNIISNNLQYQRKDDVVMSAIAINNYSTTVDVMTKDGQMKTRQKQMKVFVWSDPKTQTIKSKVITND